MRVLMLSEGFTTQETVITPQPRTSIGITELTVDNVLLSSGSLEIIKTLEVEEKEQIPQELSKNALKGIKNRKSI